MIFYVLSDELHSYMFQPQNGHLQATEVHKIKIKITIAIAILILIIINIINSFVDGD
jgi:hypothetical protein